MTGMPDPSCAAPVPAPGAVSADAAAKADRIIAAMREKGIPADCFVIAVDGRCGSGKTTLTAVLCDRLNADAVHMDYFYLTPEQRTKARFSEPGGNVN